MHRQNKWIRLQNNNHNSIYHYHNNYDSNNDSHANRHLNCYEFGIDNAIKYAIKFSINNDNIYRDIVVVGISQHNRDVNSIHDGNQHCHIHSDNHSRIHSDNYS